MYPSPRQRSPRMLAQSVPAATTSPPYLNDHEVLAGISLPINAEALTEPIKFRIVGHSEVSHAERDKGYLARNPLRTNHRRKILPNAVGFTYHRSLDGKSAYRPCDLEFGGDEAKARLGRFSSKWSCASRGCSHVILIVCGKGCSRQLSFSSLGDAPARALLGATSELPVNRGLRLQSACIESFRL